MKGRRIVRVPRDEDRPLYDDLTFTIEQSELREWCWAAVALGVARRYGLLGPGEQCHVAAAVLARACCPPGGYHFDPLVNRPAPLDVALQKVGAYQWHDQTTLSFDEIAHQITAKKRAVCAGIRWPDGRFHFVALSGYGVSLGKNWLIVNDPLGGSSGWVEESALRTDYGWDELGNPLHGRWEWTYWTLNPGGP